MMSLKRSWLACRLRTRIFAFAISIIFISMVLMYRALMSHHDNRQPQISSMPSMEKRNHLHFNAKMSEIDLLKRGADNHAAGVGGPGLAGIAAFKDRDLLNADSKEAINSFLQKLYPHDWAHAEDTDDVALELKYLLIDYGFESKMSCQDIDRLRLGHPISFSRAKYIEYAYQEGEDSGNSYDSYYNRRSNQVKRTNTAVKSPSADIDAKVACMKQVYDPDFCSTMGNYKLLREILFMATLRHANILGLKGYCLRGNRLASKLQEKGLIMVTESGTALSSLSIRLSSWYQRIRMAIQVCQLLIYLETTPFGSLRLHKLDPKDLVLVGGDQVKLADLDELEVGERKCQDASHCKVQGLDKGTQCVDGRCVGLNALLNLDKAVRAVFSLLLKNHNIEDATHILASLEKLSMSPQQLMDRLNKQLSQIE